MTAGWHPVSRDAADVIAIGAERVIDDGREVMDADPRVVRDLARTVVAMRDGVPDCRTTHHTGCACHEARRDARERELADALREALATAPEGGAPFVVAMARAKRVLDQT